MVDPMKRTPEQGMVTRLTNFDELPNINDDSGSPDHPTPRKINRESRSNKPDLYNRHDYQTQL